MTSPESAPALHATQRRIASWIRRSSAPEADAVAALLRADAERPPLSRLGVYANAWFVRIHDALHDDFGALAALVGDDAFRELVRAYLEAHPTTSPSLRDAGVALPRFLAAHEAAAGVRAAAPCAADLAALEWALVDAFDAPDAPVLDRAALAAVEPEAWDTLRLFAAPSLTVLSLRWPAHRVKQAFDADGAEAAHAAAAALSAEPTTLRVWRRDERVFHRPVTAPEPAALAALADGETFGALCARVAGEVGADDAVARVAGLLETWLADGVLSRCAR
jgi:hypothetical protein